jgi:hypothetical protein
MKSALAQLISDGEHAAVGHVAAGAVGAHKECARRSGQGRVEDRGRFFVATDLDLPL